MTGRSPDIGKPDRAGLKEAHGSTHAVEPTSSRALNPALWQQQLVQKDELILALTEQLEQAAEQLDRLHRNGSDRKRAPTGGGLPGTLAEDLQRMVQQWDDLQAAVTLGRLEVQVGEIRELVARPQVISPPVSTWRNASSYPEIHEEPADLHQDEDETTSQAPVQPSWEKLKSQLLEAEQPSTVSEQAAVEAEPPLSEPPAALNPETATPADLWAAIDLRDEYIRMLLSRLHRVEVQQPLLALQSRETGSEELVARMGELEQRLQEYLRSAEVELSVSRARLARERAQLTQQQELIDRQLKKLGLSSPNDLEPNALNPSSTQERRWARFLGKPRGE